MDSDNATDANYESIGCGVDAKLWTDAILKILMVEERIEEKLDAVLSFTMKRPTRQRSTVLNGVQVPFQHQATPEDVTSSPLRRQSSYEIDDNTSLQKSKTAFKISIGDTVGLARSSSKKQTELFSGEGARDAQRKATFLMPDALRRTTQNRFDDDACTPNTYPVQGVRMRHSFEVLLEEQEASTVEGGDSMHTMFTIGQSPSQHSDSGVSRKGRCSCLPINPNSRFLVCWSVFTIIVLFAELTYVPFVLAWDVDLGTIPIYTLAFWSIDACISFGSGSYNGEGEINPIRVSAKAYAMSWFPLDMSIILLDSISILALAGSDGVKLLRFSKLARMWRILAVLRISKLSRNVNRLLDMMPFANGLRMIFRVAYLCVIILWSLHFIACAWYLMGKFGPTDTEVRWLDLPSAMSDGSFMYVEQQEQGFQYIICFHWSVATFTLGNMEVGYANSYERMFGVTFTVVSFLFGSVLISLLSAIFVDHQTERMEITVKLRIVDRFLGENDVNNLLALRVQKVCLDRLKMKEKLAFKDTVALQNLPTSLYKDLRYEIIGRFLRMHDLFNCWSTLETSVVKDYSVDGVEMIFLKPGDELFKANFDSEDAYFFCSGELTYSKFESDLRTTSVLVPAGTWLSEAALWSHWKHVGTSEAQNRSKIAIASYKSLANHVQGHRLIRAITLNYCHLFCHGMSLAASPPYSQSPDDMRVPLTKFAEMLMHFPNDLQTIIGHQAIKIAKLGKKSAPKLEAEVTAGKCVAYINTEGELERTVLVMAMTLQDDEGHVLYQVGEVVPQTVTNDHGEEEHKLVAVPELKLPGLKQDRREHSGDTLKRLLAKKMKILTDKFEHVNTISEDETGFSKEFGVKTRYVRTKMICIMRDEFPAKPVSRDIVIDTSPTRMMSTGSGLHVMGPRASMGRPFKAAGAVPEAHSPITCYVIFEGKKPVIYAWLKQDFADVLKQSTPHHREDVLNMILSNINFDIIEQGPYDEVGLV